VKRFRVGLAGLGAAARRIHVPAYSRLGSVQIVGGADPLTPAGFRFPVFTTAEELIEKTRPDVLCVLAPPDAHYALTKLGLTSGCHVFCEKPLAGSLEEADELVALAARTGRRLAVNQEYRFMKIHEAARRLVGRPEFGDLLFLSVEQTFYTTAATEAGWRGRDPERTCKEFGVHVLDLCRYYFDEEPIAVTASMPRPRDPDGPDRLNLIRLDFAGQRVAHITLDRLSRGRHRYLSMRLDGTAGCIETELGGSVEVTAGVRGGTRRPFLSADVSLGGRARLYHGERSRKIASEPLDVFAAATRRLFEAFLAAIDRGDRPPCDGEDNRRSLALVRAAYESSRIGATVAL
jgi:D-apiose dehydrogenase